MVYLAYDQGRYAPNMRYRTISPQSRIHLQIYEYRPPGYFRVQSMKMEMPKDFKNLLFATIRERSSTWTEPPYLIGLHHFTGNKNLKTPGGR